MNQSLKNTLPVNSVFATHLLTDKGWMHNTRVTINENGYVQSIKQEQKAASDKVVDVLLPGVPNLHSHGFQWSMAGLAEYKLSGKDSFWTWRDMMYQFLDKIDPGDLKIIAKALYIDMLKAGYTEVGEFHYLHNDCKGNQYGQIELLSLQMIEAAREVGLGICHLPVIYQFSGFDKKVAGDGQKRFTLSSDKFQLVIENLRKKYLNDNLVTVGMAPHSLRAVDIYELPELTANLAGDFPIHIHIAEQLSEVEQCKAVYGQRPVELLYSLLQIDQQWCLIHATHLNSMEVQSIANSKAVVGLCPTTEANLGDGIFPLLEFYKNDGRWGIGSDSHVSVSVLEELRWLEYGQRLQHQGRTLYTNQQNSQTSLNLYQQALKGGAQALKSEAGVIEVGSRADFIGLKIPAQYHGFSSDQIFSRYLFSSRDNWINDVMVSGNWLVTDGVHPLEDKASADLVKVYKKLNQ